MCSVRLFSYDLCFLCKMKEIHILSKRNDDNCRPMAINVSGGLVYVKRNSIGL